MGCWTKKCKRNNCENRCQSYFPNNVQLRDGCKGACQESYNLINSREDYVCSGLVNEKSVILAYGYDPCEGGESIASIQNEWKESDSTRILQDNIIKVLLISAVVLFVALMIIIYKKNQQG